MSRDTRILENRFESRLRIITKEGIELPSEITELQERLKSRQIVGTPLRDRLVAALVNADKKADLPMLWAAALAESIRDNELRLDVDDAVRDGISTKIRAVYSKHANRVYNELAERFNAAAVAFTAAVEAVDPDLPAIVVLRSDKEKQQAWFDAQDHARELTRLIEPLATAAALADVGHDVNPDEQLPLTVDTEGHDRETLWAAWDIEERAAESARAIEAGINTRKIEAPQCGRWGALHKMGATIRACPLDLFWAYPRNPDVFAPSNITTLGRIPDQKLRGAAI